ncbi:MAG: hypothetical protein IT460_13315 [Planctomycetes bacterium]|nr:hypothetical protein [Planctomycetota bacterium]
MTRRGVVLLLLALGLASATARAGDGPADPGKEVDRLLAEVASDDYAVREAARKRLSTLAPTVRDLLRARREDPDPEVRRTVEALLAAIGEPDAPEAPEGTLGTLGLVTFAAEGPMEAVAGRFARDVGGVLRLPPAMASAATKLSVERVPYFDAVAALLEPVGAEVPDGFDEAGQALAAVRSSPPIPAAAAGPFRLEVESVTTARSLRPGVRPRWTLGLRLLWSPLVHVVTFQSPTVVRAVGAGGQPVRAVEMGTTTYGVGGGRRLSSTQVTLDAAAEGDAVSTLAELELRLRARVRHGIVATEVEGLDPTALPLTRSVALPDGRVVKVTVESAAEDPDRAGWAAIGLTLVLPKGVPPDSVRATLRSPDGATRPLLDLSSRVVGADGTLRLTLRAPGTPGGGAGRTLRVEWATREEDIPVPFTLRDVPLR